MLLADICTNCDITFFCTLVIVKISWSLSIVIDSTVIRMYGSCCDNCNCSVKSINIHMNIAPGHKGSRFMCFCVWNLKPTGPLVSEFIK